MNENTSEEKPLFPMRINKYLAMEGRGSRRDMDELVDAGRVLINGRVAVLGDKVNEGDKIEVRFHGNKERQKGNDMAIQRLRKKGGGKR